MSAADYRNAIVRNAFGQFGYTPTDAEVDALVPTIGSSDQEGVIYGEVADYIQAHQEIMGAQSAIQGQLQTTQSGQTNAQQLGGQYVQQAGQTAQGAAGQYQQAMQQLSQAPQLFGSMSPDQVNNYLAPLQNQFNYGLGQVQGSAAQRGIAGSSLEAQAMAQAQTQYQQNVLQQGLGVGLQAQQNKAALLQSLGQQQYGQASQQYALGQQQYGLAPQYGQQALAGLQMNNQVSGALAGLAPQEQAAANQQLALRNQYDPTKGNLGQQLLAVGLGGLFGAATNPLNPQAGFGSGALLGGTIESSATGNPQGAQIGSAFNTYGQAPNTQYGGLNSLLGSAGQATQVVGNLGGSGGQNPTGGLAMAGAMAA